MILIEVATFGIDPKDLEKKTERIENQRKNRDCPDYSIVKVGLNTVKNPGDLKWLTVT